MDPDNAQAQEGSLIAFFDRGDLIEKQVLTSQAAAGDPVDFIGPGGSVVQAAAGDPVDLTGHSTSVIDHQNEDISQAAAGDRIEYPNDQWVVNQMLGRYTIPSDDDDGNVICIYCESKLLKFNFCVAAHILGSSKSSEYDVTAYDVAACTNHFADEFLETARVWWKRFTSRTAFLACVRKVDAAGVKPKMMMCRFCDKMLKSARFEVAKHLIGTSKKCSPSSGAAVPQFLLDESKEIMASHASFLKKNSVEQTVVLMKERSQTEVIMNFLKRIFDMPRSSVEMDVHRRLFDFMTMLLVDHSDVFKEVKNASAS